MISCSGFLGKNGDHRIVDHTQSKKVIMQVYIENVDDCNHVHIKY